MAATCWAETATADRWFFVVLTGTNYAISDAYVATQADLLIIFQALGFIKRQIETWLAEA